VLNDPDEEGRDEVRDAQILVVDLPADPARGAPGRWLKGMWPHVPRRNARASLRRDRS